MRPRSTRLTGSEVARGACWIAVLAAIGLTACGHSASQGQGPTADSNVQQPLQSDQQSVAPTPSPIQASPSPVGNLVATPFQLVLGQSSLNAILMQAAVMGPLQGEVQQGIPDFGITNPFDVTISGIQLDVKYAFNAPVLNPTTQEWDFSTQNVSADLTVQNIAADETIQAGGNGTTIGIHLQGSCNQIHLVLPSGSSQATGSINLSLSGGVPQLKLTSFQPNWTPGSWQIASMSCQGPSGFGDLVQQQVSAQLREIDPYVTAIRQQVEAQLARAVSGGPLTFSMNFSDSVSVKLAASAFNATGPKSTDPIAVQGDAEFQFQGPMDGAGCGATVTEFQPLVPSASTLDSLVLPFAATQALLRCAYLGEALQYRFASSQVQQFTALENSWLEDVLVWPDLVHFKDNAPFNFGIQAFDTPYFLNASSTGTHKILVDAWLPLQLEVDAPVNGRSAPYIRFQTRYYGRVTLQIANGSASLQTDPSLPLNITKQWDPAYVATYHPNQRIWMGKIESAAKDFLSQQGLSFALPNLTVGDKLRLVPQTGDIEGDNVIVGIQLQNF